MNISAGRIVSFAKIMVATLILSCVVTNPCYALQRNSSSTTKTFSGTITDSGGASSTGTVSITTDYVDGIGYVSNVTILDSFGRTYSFPEVLADRYRDGGSEKYDGPGFFGWYDWRKSTGDFQFEDGCGFSSFNGKRIS